MEVLLDIFLFTVVYYYCHQFILLLIKMEGSILPTKKELESIRIRPEKTIDFPSFSQQKWGMIIYSISLLIVIIVLLLGAFVMDFGRFFQLLLFIPLFNLQTLLNLFAVVEGGILSGSRFVPWEKIKSFEFVRIDVNHKFYGYSKEVNNQYELVMKTRLFPVTCIVTRDDMKERLQTILTEYGVLEKRENHSS
ncbi:hypothetical protein [Oceanobacillus senegalensis]|uniref:hypothetical protein n=1 Tax=Oceanobacillus senegalensis TaxID=1936063 RepID=UPI000A304805|nr:hypothetical protein [Oceanobacillus senegalensis]